MSRNKKICELEICKILVRVFFGFRLGLGLGLESSIDQLFSHTETEQGGVRKLLSCSVSNAETEQGRSFVPTLLIFCLFYFIGNKFFIQDRGERGKEGEIIFF